ncbi:MAG: GGDEF domain-containing protein [Planctomycetota bacterium]
MSAESKVIAVRAILVGKTGLDAKLRLDPSVEVLRARTPIEAIGELSSPINHPSTDPKAPAPANIVIIGESVGSAGEPGSPAARDFVAGLKTVDPSVRVLRMGLADAATAFDGSIPPDASADDLRSIIHATPRAPQPTRAQAPAKPVSHTTPEPLVVEVPSHAEFGDEGLVKSLLRGQDPIDAAIVSVRQRLGDPGAQFVPDVDRAATGEARVAWEGRLYGVLRSSRAPHSLLVRAAEWLATWFRLREQQAQLKDAAFIDALTGAYNRRYFDRYLASAIDQARDTRRPVTVLVFDVDNFKTYNDRFGHDAGDEILRETIKLLRATVRPGDRVCRVGGDEFAVIFDDPTGPREPGSKHPATIWAIADRFQQQIREHKFPKLSEHAPGQLTISGGLATFPWDGTTAEELLCRADQLALESKRQGKNVITIGPGAPGA